MRIRRVLNLLRSLARPMRVQGMSMHPTFAPGDIVCFAPPARPLPSVGQVVLVAHPLHHRAMVKRVTSVGPCSFEVGSDNPKQGTDSRHFGPLLPSQWLGLATLHVGAYPPSLTLL